MDRLGAGDHVRVHEAGHGVVGRALGLTNLRIHADGRGYTTGNYPADSTTADRVTFHAAGCGAERLLLGSVVPGHGVEDRTEIETLARSLSAEDLEAAVERAGSLIQLNEELVRALALRLRQFPRTIEGDDLEPFFVGIRGAPSG